MRISDWSSDVCSSDLGSGGAIEAGLHNRQLAFGAAQKLIGNLGGKSLNQRLRIGKTDIRSGEADDAAQDIKRFLTRDQHSCQIVKRRLRIGTAQRFMQGRNEVVMPLPILVVDSHAPVEEGG